MSNIVSHPVVEVGDLFCHVILHSGPGGVEVDGDIFDGVGEHGFGAVCGVGIFGVRAGLFAGAEDFSVQVIVADPVPGVERNHNCGDGGEWGDGAELMLFEEDDGEPENEGRRVDVGGSFGDNGGAECAAGQQDVDPVELLAFADLKEVENKAG